MFDVLLRALKDRLLEPLARHLGRGVPPNAVTVLAACAALLGSFFVNAASWMYLSAVLERRGAGARARGELTTVTMPPGLIAGAETVVLYTLFLLVPSRLAELFALMAALVYATVVQRLVWAWRHLR